MPGDARSRRSHDVRLVGQSRTGSSCLRRQKAAG